MDLLLGSNLPSRIPDEEIQVIARCIEHRVRGFLDAINTRDFNPASPPWQYKSRDFQHEAGYLCPSDLDLDEYLTLWQQMISSSLEMFCDIAELTTYVDREAGHAEVSCNIEITGKPKGIIRTSVAILEFIRERDGKNEPADWLCLKFRGVRGVDGAAAVR